MQERKLFEYAVIRIVPKVEREEFLNVGVVLYCRSDHFLDMRFALDERRCSALFAQLDMDELQTHLLAFQQICRGDAAGGAIASLSIAERFRWLTAKRSTTIQPSAVHPGLCIDPRATLEQLYEQLVL